MPASFPSNSLDRHLYDRVKIDVDFFLFGLALVAVVDLHDPAAPLFPQSIQLLFLSRVIAIGGTAAGLFGLLHDVMVFVHPQAPPVPVAVLEGHVVILFEWQSLIVPALIPPQKALERTADVGHRGKRIVLRIRQRIDVAIKTPELEAKFVTNTAVLFDERDEIFRIYRMAFVAEALTRLALVIADTLHIIVNNQNHIRTGFKLGIKDVVSDTA